MNAIEVLNDYLQKGERVDGVLHHIVASEIERLREQQKQLTTDYLNDLEVLSEHTLYIAKLRKENAKLREALEFYVVDAYRLSDLTKIIEDGGKTARQALEEDM